MSKLTWFLVALAIAGGLLSVLIGRNSNRDLRSYLGMWEGKLDAGPNSMKGYLRIKGAEHLYEMHLEGPQQQIDITGNWILLNPSRISLKARDVKIEDFGGEQKRDPNKPYLENSEVSAAYAQPLELDLSANKEKLHSLPVHFGETKGVHEFQRTFGHVR